jgi:hypothetical protein
VLDELRGRCLIERLDAGTYFLSKWRERDDPGIRDQQPALAARKLVGSFS